MRWSRRRFSLQWVCSSTAAAASARLARSSATAAVSAGGGSGSAISASRARASAAGRVGWARWRCAARSPSVQSSAVFTSVASNSVARRLSARPTSINCRDVRCGARSVSLAWSSCRVMSATSVVRAPADARRQVARPSGDVRTRAARRWCRPAMSVRCAQDRRVMMPSTPRSFAHARPSDCFERESRKKASEAGPGPIGGDRHQPAAADEAPLQAPRREIGAHRPLAVARQPNHLGEVEDVTPRPFRVRRGRARYVAKWITGTRHAAVADRLTPRRSPRRNRQ